MRLQTLSSERQALISEVKQLKLQLEEERTRKKSGLHNSHNGPTNGSDSDSDSFEHQSSFNKFYLFFIFLR